MLLRGLSRLFRFKLRLKNVRVEMRGWGYRVVADWTITDRKTGQIRDNIHGATRWEAKKALRWYRRFGSE
jgi:hypothetical protein